MTDTEIATQIKLERAHVNELRAKLWELGKRIEALVAAVAAPQEA